MDESCIRRCFELKEKDAERFKRIFRRHTNGGEIELNYTLVFLEEHFGQEKETRQPHEHPRTRHRGNRALPAAGHS